MNIFFLLMIIPPFYTIHENNEKRTTKEEFFSSIVIFEGRRLKFSRCFLRSFFGKIKELRVIEASNINYEKIWSKQNSRGEVDEN